MSAWVCQPHRPGALVWPVFLRPRSKVAADRHHAPDRRGTEQARDQRRVDLKQRVRLPSSRVGVKDDPRHPDGRHECYGRDIYL